MADQSPLQINIRDVIAAKNKRILKWIPNFVLNCFERFVHQVELNELLRNHYHEDGIEFAHSVVRELGAHVRVINGDLIPLHGNYVMVANHPMAGLDALCLFSVVGKIRSDISIIANDILAHIPQFRKYFIPVNKLGKSTKDAMLRVDQSYKNAGMILVFPAGLCSRKIEGKIVDLEWQKSFLIKAIQYNLHIIPVHINGANSNRFYRIANWRKALGLRFNIEMMTLADELFKHKDKELTITIGQPISPQAFSKQNAVEDAQKIKDYVYNLAQNPQAVYDS